MRKHRDTKLVTTKVRRNQIIIQQICFSEYLLAIEIKKKKEKETQIFLNKPLHLILSILGIHKIIMH